MTGVVVAKPLYRTVLPGTAMIAVTFGLARYGYGLLLPDMQAELSISSGTAGLISSCTYVSYLLANVGVVWLTDRHGPRTAIGLAAALAVAGMVVLATAHSGAVLAVGVLVGGAAAGLAYPPYSDLVAGAVPAPRRDVAWSTISSGTGWGVALAGPIAITAGGQWRIAWLVFVALAVSAGIMAVSFAPRRPRRLRRPQLSWTWFFCPRSRPLLLAAVLIGAGSAVWWTFCVDALRHAGIGPTTARVVYAVCGAAGIIASFSGAVLKGIGLRRGYLAACTLLAVSLALLGLVSAHLVAALGAAVLFGVFYVSVTAMQGIWSARVFADHPAAGLTAVNVALTLGTLTGPALAGVSIARFGFPATLVAAAVVIVAALPFCPPTARRKRILDEHVCTAAPVEDDRT
ncbi:MFS transporter [Labedaea rhizosphaerae]|uniref:Putative MFS family arabinose efflux permease n=1 Tax=Labedaea rhizosphaerae TaxID=598644 RepID=A0A4R6SF70_LABRH|nr:MFS transporter [Labedaea rhizosphaerae]TDQ00204.1 putative MFS family arabinose efflux permease [Labedaea rhizosphaerae]